MTPEVIGCGHTRRSAAWREDERAWYARVDRWVWGWLRSRQSCWTLPSAVSNSGCSRTWNAHDLPWWQHDALKVAPEYREAIGTAKEYTRVIALLRREEPAAEH
ncbi:hypothetical protein ABT369_29830 [Dactylosporangium sp. NPDC000244]|uniref:hypothetical protein n=1 Tax=Dactylosporangium sp. NPDC000244 TaxID=3154365 RepID=UPI00332C14DF